MGWTLPGRVALVTGASRGIGASVAVKLAERGAAVIVNFRSKAARAGDVVSSIRQAGGEAIAVQADLTQAGDIAAMAAFIRARHGGLDVLVLNASGGWSATSPHRTRTRSTTPPRSACWTPACRFCAHPAA
jgi:NAD(P)-dependent dehydrogenase (short-subunit alcohol dehydrogenase family)